MSASLNRSLTGRVQVLGLLALVFLPTAAYAQYRAIAYGVNGDVGQYGCHAADSYGVLGASTGCSGSAGGTSHTASANEMGRVLQGAVTLSGTASNFAYSQSEGFLSDFLVFSGPMTPAQLYFYFAFSTSLTAGAGQYNLAYGRIMYGSSSVYAGSVSDNGSAATHYYTSNVTDLGAGVYRTAVAYEGDQNFGVYEYNLARFDGGSGYGATSSTFQLLGIDAVNGFGESLAGSIDCTFRDSGQACALGNIDAPLTATPEPASLTLMATALLGMLAVARRRRDA